jgi:hypothetical protein
MISSTIMRVVAWYLIPYTNSFWYFSHIDTNRQTVSKQIVISLSPKVFNPDAPLKNNLKGSKPAYDLIKQSKKPSGVTVLLRGDS